MKLIVNNCFCMLHKVDITFMFMKEKLVCLSQRFVLQLTAKGRNKENHHGSNNKTCNLSSIASTPPKKNHREPDSWPLSFQDTPNEFLGISHRSTHWVHFMEESDLHTWKIESATDRIMRSRNYNGAEWCIKEKLYSFYKKHSLQNKDSIDLSQSSSYISKHTNTLVNLFNIIHTKQRCDPGLSASNLSNCFTAYIIESYK